MPSSYEDTMPAYCAWCDSKDCIHAERDNMTVELAFLRKERGEMVKALTAEAQRLRADAIAGVRAEGDANPAWLQRRMVECAARIDAALSAAGEGK